MLLTEFDNNKIAMLNPCNIVSKIDNMPKTVVSFFEENMFEHFLSVFKPKVLCTIGCAVKNHPIYKINFEGNEIAVVQAGIGGPYCVGNFEEIVELGAKNILLFGSCGCLVDAKKCSVIVPNSALRDEGTSFHYAEPSDEIELDGNLVEKTCKFFDEKNITYLKGKTWTTDAFYRETKEKIERRKKQGAICVEMECASMTAFAKFRNVNFMTFFYTGDNLSNEVWDKGSLSKEILEGKDVLIPLALQLANKIFD